MNNNCYYDDEKDYGGNPYVLNINQAAIHNKYYRRAIWTGTYLQTTLMSIPIGGDIGAEIHHDTDQFLRIVQGRGIVQFGKTKADLKNAQRVDGSYAIFVPAGTWHNVKNIGSTPLKLYSIYAPPHHPKGTPEWEKP